MIKKSVKVNLGDENRLGLDEVRNEDIVTNKIFIKTPTGKFITL